MLKLLSRFTEITLAQVRWDLEIKLPDNIFSNTINLLYLSRFQYGLLLRDDESGIRNLNSRWDNRLAIVPRYMNAKQKPAYLIPPPGYDGFLELGWRARWVDEKTRTKKVSIIAVLFHEAFELYLTQDKEMQYREAHEYAREKEIDSLLVQFPDLSEFPAGGILIRA